MKTRLIYLLPIVLLVSLASLWLTAKVFPTNLVSQICTLGIVLFTPGFLTTQLLKFRTKNTWVYLLHSLGLSIFWTYLLGLFATYVLTKFSISKPIEGDVLLYTQSALLILLSIGAGVRNWKDVLSLRLVGLFSLHGLLYLASIAVSVIGLAGAFMLNAGGTFELSLGWFVVMAVVLFLVAQTRGSVFAALYPYFLFVASLSLLWMYAGRSNYVVGWDIVQEYGVAQDTILNGAWNTEDVKNAYNACLSITLFPAITANATHLSVDTLYKFVFPFIFAHFPIITYVWLARMSKRVYAFLAVIYLIAQPFFTQTMTGLARQEIAFIFFALIFLALFSRVVVGKSKLVLVSSYLLALVLSHYSTTYMTIAMLSLAFMGVVMLAVLKKIPLPELLKGTGFYQNWLVRYQSDIKWWVLPILLTFSFGWFFVITQVGSNITSTITGSIQNLSDMLNGRSSSQEVQSALPGGSNSLYTSEKDLKYYEHIHDLVLHNIPKDKIDQLFKEYPLVPFGEVLIPARMDTKTASQLNKLLVYFKDGLKILLILGAAFQIIRTFRKTDQNLDLVLLSTVGVMIVTVMIAHPTLGLRYNISRVFMQLLVVVSFSLVVGLDLLMWLLPRQIRVFAISGAMILALVYLHGATVPVLGGIPMLHFYNLGTEFEKSYVYKGELKAARWLQEKRNAQNTVYGDDFSGLRLVKEVSFFPNTMIIPAVLENNSTGYVYLSHTNKVLGIARVNFGNKQLTYEFPNEYLEEDRNLIYSNQNAAIYR